MDKSLLKEILLISALLGCILAGISLIPFLAKITVFLLMTVVSLAVIIYLRRLGKLELFTVKESIFIGAICGFVSYFVFSMVFLPIVYVLNLFVPITYLGGLVLVLKLANFPLLLMFTIFISLVSVIFNAFSSLLYYYIVNSFETVKDDKQFKLK